MATNLNATRGQGRGPFARIKDALRAARTREAESIVARYAHGRMTDAAEREMTEKLLHLGGGFRF